MFNIEKYLQKFSKNIADTNLRKKQISEIIEKYTELKIPPEEVEIKDYIVHIKSSPAAKNKIFIFKSKILEDLADSVSVKIVDVR